MYRHIFRFWVICFMVFMCFLNAGVNAQEEYTEGDLIYIIEDESITITGYYGNEETVYIPSMIGGYPVSRISAEAFAGSGVTEIHLPETIMSIEAGAIPTASVAIYEDAEMETTHQESINSSDESTGDEELTDTEEVYVEDVISENEKEIYSRTEDNPQNGDTQSSSPEAVHGNNKEISNSNYINLYIFGGIIVIIISVIGFSNWRKKR